MLSTEEFSGLSNALANSQYGDAHVEVEVRFWPRTKRGITPGAFERLRRHLQGRKETVTNSIDQSQTRQNTNSVLRKTTYSDGTISWGVKDKIWRVDSKYGFRLSMSLETKVVEPGTFAPTSTRRKTRYSYPVHEGFRADLTVVTGPEAGDTTPLGRRSPLRVGGESSHYEVELEVVDYRTVLTDEGRQRFSVAIHDIFTVLYDTNKPYTKDEYNAIVRYIKDMLMGAKSANTPLDELSPYMVYQARNLKALDLVGGGLVPHPQRPKRDRYTVTHKTDGSRKVLVVHRSGIWLVMAPDEANLVFTPEEQRESIGKYGGTILDGELIDTPATSRIPGASGAKYWYLAFDCMASSSDDAHSSTGNTDVMGKPHAIRMNYAQYLADGFKESPILQVDTKKFYPVPGRSDRGFAGFVSAGQFFETMREREAERPALTYDTDGYIFTPTGPLYPHRSDIGRNPDKRTLTSSLDICKWKLEQKLSIDFALFRTDGKPVLYSGGSRERYTLFVGSPEHPFSGEVEDTPMTLDLLAGIVVEYVWNNGKFSPIRVRTDKPRPNRIDVAMDTWNLIQDPLYISTLTGRDLALFFRYHNRIKRSLLAQAKGTLLDIGSGRGGDISKWRTYSRVVAVEPNEDYIKEFLSRARSPVRVATTKEEAERMGREAAQAGEKILLVKARGEDSEIVTTAVNSFIGGKVSAVGLMLSMSFFWRDRETLEGLANTIRRNATIGTKILYLTIDGDLVEQMYHPVFGGLRGSFEGRANIQYFPDDRSLTITISRTEERPTIVVDQVEWLVHLDDLVSALGVRDDRHRADKEPFIDPEGTNLTKMYTYGVWTIATRELEVPGSSLAAVDLAIASSREEKTAQPNPRPTLPPLPPFVKPIRSATIRESPLGGIRLPEFVESAPLRRRREPLQRLRRLPPLPVTYTRGEARGDDAVETISVAWFTRYPVVRIATIGSFFDAYLKGWYPPYANTPSYPERRNIVQNLRNDLSRSLRVIDPKFGKNYYETTAKGFLPALAESGEKKFTIEEVSRTLASNEPIGRELARYAIEMVSTTNEGERNRGVGVAFFLPTNIDLVSKGAIGRDSPMVFLAGDPTHYELLGVDYGSCGIQTLFFPGDEFTTAYDAKRSIALVSTAIGDVDSQIRVLSAIPSREEVEKAVQRRGLCQAEREAISRTVVIDPDDRRRIVAIRRNLMELEGKARGLSEKAKKGESFDHEELRALVEAAMGLKEEARVIGKKY